MEIFKKKTLPAGPISAREKQIEKEPMLEKADTGKNGKKTKRNTEKTKLQILKAPNWCQSHKFPALELTCHRCKKVKTFGRSLWI